MIKKANNVLPMPISDELLMQVEKPARYIGKEINMVKKDLDKIDVRFAFAFPDVYEIGMSHLGLQILYGFINRREDAYCERVFAPWPDMEKIMVDNNYPLFSLETYTPIDQFDFLGFTLQYEMSYTNIINMLSLGNIPLLAENRGGEYPIVIAGGPCAYNPEPLADIIDVFYIGEGEVSFDEILDIYKECKSKGETKLQILEKLAGVNGLYIPRFYDVTYNEDNTIAEFVPNNVNAPAVINKVIVNDMDKSYFPSEQLVPLIETIHDRVTVEVFRGCIRGCRFCQAGYVYRPVREKQYETVIDQAEKLIDTSGHEEVSLSSLSTSDYSQFENLATGLIDKFSCDSVNIALPSLRVDAFNLDIMKRVQEVRKSSLTFAPEAGTQRLRDVINKNISEEDVLNGCFYAFEGGWNRIKLYFMTGLPTETEEDLLGIGKLSNDIIRKFYELPKEKRNRGVNLVVSTSCFVPKPFTPFQWTPQDDMETFINKHGIVRRGITSKQVRYNHHDAKVSVLEAVVARGDRRVSKLIIEAWKLGARFDGWTEHFKFETWEKAFENTGLSMNFYTTRKREYTEKLPWDHINIGVSKQFLIDEAMNALNEQTTPDCRTKCSNCGATVFEGGVCFEK